MMDDSPVFEADETPGYVSADAKRHFLVAAGATIGITVVAQFLLPQILMLGAMQGPMFGGMNVETPHGDRAAFWNGRIWYPEGSLDDNPYTNPPHLRHWVPGEKDVSEEKISLNMDVPWLLPDGDRLWLIAHDAVGFLEGGEPLIVKPRKKLATVTRPFLYEGAPAVIEIQTQSGSGPAVEALDAEAVAESDQLTLWTYEDGEWNKGSRIVLRHPDLEFPESHFATMYGSYDEPEGLAELQVVTTTEGHWVFWEHMEVLYARRGLPLVETKTEANETSDAGDGNEAETADDADARADSAPRVEGESFWEEVGPIESGWKAVVVDGSPVVLHSDSASQEPQVSGKRRTAQGEWATFFSAPATFEWELGACPLEGSGRFALLTQRFAGGLQIDVVEDGKVVETASLGGGVFDLSFENDYFRNMAISWAIPPALSVVMIGIIMVLMGRFRTSVHVGGTSRAQLASIVRRAIAKVIDSTLFSIPLVIAGYFFWQNWEFESIFQSGQAILNLLIEMLLVVTIVIAYSFGTLIVLGFLEGRFGQTPGKWCMGIRVLRSNLLPCGFWRGLVRNVLMIGDQFFNYAVGVALIAFTVKWQRLGDLAADTVVIDVRRSEIEEFQ